jgi:uncharacterized protein DUF6629
VLFCDSKLCGQWCSGHCRSRDFDKHRRELLFAALPLLFAIHQFIEGFVWLGLDGILSPAVAHDMGAAFMLYAQGLLPFLAPLSIFLFEPNKKNRHRMLPFVVLGGATTLYILWALTAFPLQLYVKQNSIVYINQGTNNTPVALVYLVVTCGALFFSEIRMMVFFGVANLVILLLVIAVKRSLCRRTRSDSRVLHEKCTMICCRISRE